MAKDWDSFVSEYCQEQYDNMFFYLTRVISKRFDSPIERVMYVVLNQEFSNIDGVKLTPQKRFEQYTVDFHISYETTNGEIIQFVIECDGHDYHERTKKQAEHDKKRDRYFTEKGFIVLRYTGSEILRDYREITEPIWAICAKKDMAI